MQWPWLRLTIGGPGEFLGTLRLRVILIHSFVLEKTLHFYKARI